MTLPDFLVIGAAKSGTISIYHYLRQHPHVYMCPVNETNFFALDGFDLDGHFRGPGDRATVERHCVKSLDAYRALFAGARPGQRLGEVSPLYLYSDHAPQRIRHHRPEAKLIAILRQPTERAFSNYRQYRLAGLEPLPTFAEALAAETTRMAQRWGPWPFWFYYDAGRYDRQLARYYALFDSQQILVCDFDELQANPVGLMQKLYRFIGVDDGYVPDTAVRHNVGTRPRLRLIQRLMTESNPFKRAVKLLLPPAERMRLRHMVLGWNEVRPAINLELRRQLDEAYRLDKEAFSTSDPPTSESTERSR